MPSSPSRPPPKAAPDRPFRITDPPPEFAGAIVGGRSSKTTPIAEPIEDVVELSDDDLLDEVVDDAPAPTVHDAKTTAPPQASTAAPLAAVPTPVAKGPKPDSLTVLVVEDDTSIRALVVRALATQYTVYEAVDGQHASEILDAIPAPACIVSDVMMPRLDGIGLAKKVKATASLKWTPIIFLTAKNGALDVVLGINSGARHYLSKPFKMKELLDKVGSVVVNAKKG